jgi:hypothetical protein
MATPAFVHLLGMEREERGNRRKKRGSIFRPSGFHAFIFCASYDWRLQWRCKTWQLPEE